MKSFIGIDNGVSGTIGVIYGDETDFFSTPTKSGQNYTKKKGNITRIDAPKLLDAFRYIKERSEAVMAILERPMVNPRRFQATTSALRALESTIVVLETLKIPYAYIDSKEWQRALLPKGVSGDELKKASKDIGIRLFPQHEELIESHGDADGILMAEFCRKNYVQI